MSERGLNTVSFAGHAASSAQFKALYAEGMGLVEETASYLDGPGRTAAKVLPGDKLGDHKVAAPVFDMVREIPQVVDGIRCQCGCASLETKYSLLSCFEEEGMAGHCEVCQKEGRLVYRLHKQGKTLKEIRDAIDAKFG